MIQREVSQRQHIISNGLSMQTGVQEKMVLILVRENISQPEVM